MIEQRKEQAKTQKADLLNAIQVAFEGLEHDGVAAVKDIAEEIGVSTDSIKRWFGNGKRARSDYKKNFIAFESSENGMLYLKRAGKVGTDVE